MLKGTIEHKIVALHARKRQLADNLLEGAGAPGRLDAEALMKLLRLVMFLSDEGLKLLIT